MIEAFKKYVGNYDMEVRGIKLKYEHSFRVMELSKKYAEKLNFSEEDIHLATLIGLLHDIGRFEQMKVYNTFVDRKSIDHADYSVEQLFDKGEIKLFYNNEEHYNIIKQAIKNHNKYNISGVEDERTLMHCHLIRDTDKIDIVYNWAHLGLINYAEDGCEISPKVLENLKNHKPVSHDDVKTKSDRIACTYAFVFDTHYDECLKEIKQYLDDKYEQFEHKKVLEEMKKIVDDYVDDRLGIKQN
jgi:putative nucleotidyltransferase with HDIG domain